MFPRKGSLRQGADADVALVDPGRRWEVRDADILSKAGWSPYAGRTLTGGAVRTFLRGREIAAGGRVTGERDGRFVAGAGSA